MSTPVDDRQETSPLERKLNPFVALVVGIGIIAGIAWVVTALNGGSEPAPADAAAPEGESQAASIPEDLTVEITVPMVDGVPLIRIQANRPVTCDVKIKVAGETYVNSVLADTEIGGSYVAEKYIAVLTAASSAGANYSVPGGDCEAA
jgi:hypothetical protein